MRGTKSTPMRLLALKVAAVMVAVGVAVPLLDAGLGVRGPVIESEHSAASCVVGHDHTICTQVGANLALGGGETAVPVRTPLVVFLSPAPLEGHLDEQFVEGHRSRAPPLARA